MDILNLTIDVIGLSIRSQNGLRRAGVNTVAEMLKCTEDSLSQVRNLGAKSVGEILSKIDEYKQMSEDETDSGIYLVEEFVVPENYDDWIKDEKNKQYVNDWLKEKEVRIESIELLPTRAFNLLMFDGYEYVSQIAFITADELMKVHRMDEFSAHEIEKLTARFLKDSKDEIFNYISEKMSKNTVTTDKSILELISFRECQDAILRYARVNDIDIKMLGLSNRAKNCLLANGFTRLSEIILKSRSDLLRLSSMGSGSVDDIAGKIKDYLLENESRIMTFINGGDEALWDDITLRKKILELYSDVGFGGLSLNDIIERLDLPEEITQDRIKHIIGTLLADNELEYVDYRCYRVFGQFKDALDGCTEIDDRSKDFINRRLNGDTLEAIAKDNGLTRERVRQIVKKDIGKVRDQYFVKTGMSLFDEDYYRYLYENYYFEKKEGTEWLGIPAHVWSYLDITEVKRGKKDLQSAVEDNQGLDIGLRLKIKNYLNRNKIYVDGMWVEKRRAELEEVAVRKFCQEDVSFNDFIDIYNNFLRTEEIPFDDDIYYTDSVIATRRNHLCKCRFLLWKQNEQIRYYDIDGRDFTNFFDSLNLDSYENIELSTAKLMRDYPETMAKYDIRDHYELHNLLRKIVPEGSFHGFHCSRMPDIVFGNFDRDAAILDMLLDNAPISMRDLADLVSEEYGYDPLVIMGSYFHSVMDYNHKGVFHVDQKQMSSSNKELLQKALTDDFYYIDEIRRIYIDLIPAADQEEINPYNLKSMGFQVYSRYALQHYSSLEAYFTELLTCEDIIDISSYRKRYVYIQMFSQKLMELKRDLTIIEFEPNQIINFRKLEKSGITRDMIQEFCDSVYEFVSDGEYFSALSIRKSGFESELYDLGFSDWFYANLLLSDNRFSSGNMLGNIILFKGKENITIKSFVVSKIREHGSVDAIDLMNELIEQYGCSIDNKWDAVYKVQGTEIYYDKILDRLYSNIDAYYSELEEAGF